MILTNSKLVDVVILSPNKTDGRNHKIDTITIHCVAGQLTAKQLGNYFLNPAVEASSNYGVGSDGKIGLYVEEKNRSWCSSNKTNDNRAITIEVASDRTHPYHVKDEVLDKLIDLLVDICERNNIPELKWKGDKSLIGKVEKQNMTVHRWFKAKDCPGEYLYNLHGEIAKKVNSIIGIKPGDKVKVLEAKTYTGKPFKLWFDVYDVISMKGDRVVIGIDGVSTAPVHISSIKKCY